MTTEESNVPEQLDMVIKVSCDACGSEMIYSAGKQMLECKHCGKTRDLPRESDMIIEKSFSDSMNLSDLATGFGTETKIFHCGNCGAETAVATDQVSLTCPFCSSDNVNTEATQTRVIQPEGIMPFAINKKTALEKYSAWIRKGLFAPSNLKKIAALEKIAGVYLPFWTYDSMTQSRWTAMAGYHYYVTQTYTQNGQTKTRQVQKTRWVPASGYYEFFFNDVLVVGSKGVTQKNVEKIYPYTLGSMVNYHPNFILGFNSEVYQKDVKEGYTVADGIMDKHIYSACSNQVPGDTHRNLNVNTHKSAITFKHILLPIWIAAYQYNKKSYQFLVNGETGKIAGKKPVSVFKIIIAVLMAAAIGFGIYYFFARK